MSRWWTSSCTSVRRKVRKRTTFARAAVRMGAPNEVRGAASVAGTFSGRARAAQPALVDGAVGAVWAQGGRPRIVFRFIITGGKIVAIDIVAEPERVSQLNPVVLGD